MGGGLFCGVYYWYMYLLSADPIKVDGAEYQGPVVGVHHTHSHTHWNFLEFRRKSSAAMTTDEESRIESRQNSHSH